MTDSIAGGGQWFKLRDVAAGLGLPVAHEVPNRGIGAVSRAARKGEVDIAVTFLLFLYDLSGGTSRFVIWTAAVGTNGQQRPERCRKVY